ncbi:MAG: hypothetical protein AAGA06_07735 [Pseudomonadota bacterium]
METMRILLVENETHMAEGTAAALAQYGFACDTASGSHDALQLLRLGSYRSAILDHYLHGETSDYLVAHLRVWHPQTRIVSVIDPPPCVRDMPLDRCDADFRFRKPLKVPDLAEVLRYLDATSDWFDCPDTGLHSAIPMRYLASSA